VLKNDIHLLLQVFDLLLLQRPLMRGVVLVNRMGSLMRLKGLWGGIVKRFIILLAEISRNI
jgi:hypothetical protein